MIFNFKDFLINEKHGVSDASIMFIDILETKTYNVFLDFLKSKEKAIEEWVDIKYRTLVPFITDSELYKEFPVVGFELIVTAKKLSSDKFEKAYGYPNGVIVSGFAANFGFKNWKYYSKIVEPKRKAAKVGLIIQLTVNIEIDKANFDIENSEHKGDLIDGINSTLYHELNHTFEHYKRTIKSPKKGEYRKPIYSRSFNTALTYAENNIWKFPNQLWTFWRENFLFLIYRSESFEMNANIQEIDYYIKKYPDKDLNDFEIWRNADIMEKFDFDEFYEDLLKVIADCYGLSKSKYDKDTVYSIKEEIVNKLKEMWLDVYEEVLVAQKATPIISIKTFENMTGYQFIEYWSKQFNKNGEYLKKKISKIKYDVQNEKIQ